jgi:uncharacterized protein (TIGR02594 family)
MDNPILRGYTNKAESESRPVIVNDKFPSSVILIASILLCGVILLLCAMPARADIISVAQSQIGLGEIGGNNKGIYVRKYLNGREDLPWCAGFVSYCAKKSGINIPYTLRARDFLKLGIKVSNPRRGDLIVFSRQGGGHVGIIKEITESTVTTIEGNLGKYPSKIREVTYYKKHIKNFLAFVRLR